MVECQASSVAALNVILLYLIQSVEVVMTIMLVNVKYVIASTDQDCNEVTNEGRNCSTSVVSLLSVLKAFKLLDLFRKRKVVVNPHLKRNVLLEEF